MFNLRDFDGDWPAALSELEPEFHAVDRDACRIWFQFYPLGLRKVLDSERERTGTDDFYQFRGSYRLEDVADTSHRFLYCHRYWAEVKKALGETDSSLVGTIRAVAAKVAGPKGLTLPIAAIGVMTLRQIGAGFLSSGYVPPVEKRTAERVLKERGSDGRAGLFSKSKPRVIFDESEADGWFPIIATQHITAAAELDKRPHHERDSRCYIGNGPIPVDCRSGTCGTCWVGVIGGNDKLEPVEEFERKRMEYFGYWDSPFHQERGGRPLIRLACQTIAQGSCGIVIPPWNGVWGQSRRARRAV